MRRFLLRLFLVIPGGEECEIMNEPVRSDFFFVGVAPEARDDGVARSEKRKTDYSIGSNVISIDPIHSLCIEKLRLIASPYVLFTH